MFFQGCKLIINYELNKCVVGLTAIGLRYSINNPRDPLIIGVSPVSDVDESVTVSSYFNYFRIQRYKTS